ncbi:ABC transporter ATP-binding protein [Aureibacillus halotolerans]|uniref:ABC-2 type transport system ATP-binding protein n=1 Tax=Aureibacillus halotolerans TaxID=1508390 RepID=A0A4V3D4K2_9BACI|nr:ABC transporter ATP-binding protein [Aureibacillus halotolerans]TDQ36597.1 ABC-2 type transport system ATP-binding protein [Aureibacillus halotolerans]
MMQRQEAELTTSVVAPSLSAVELTNVSYAYKKGGRGIHNIHLTVGKGEVFGLFGPNGSGKTTLLKAMTGLCKIDEGEISLLGHDLENDFERAMEGVGCVVEQADAYMYMNAYQNLKIAARYKQDVSAARIHEVLDQVGLSAYKKERVSRYSLGMKQRLALGRALLHNPQLVLLDEPTNGLDVEGITLVRQLITELSQEHGVTFIISSHLLGEMERLCTHVGFMKDGMLLQAGPVNNLQGKQHTFEELYAQAITSGGAGQ